MDDPPRTLIAVATYNEIENLPALVDRLEATMPSADILIVDDNSPDGTGRWAQQAAAERPAVSVIVRTSERGLGTAVLAAMRYAVAEGYDLFVNMDADFSHAPEAVPSLVTPMREADDPPDVVLGSRYVPGGRIEGWPLSRRLMSTCVNGYTRLLMRLPPRDCSGSFRCYRVETLARVDLAAVRSRGYAFFEEILWHLRRAGARFEEVPITFVDRTRGTSKINLVEAARALWTIGRLGIYGR